MDGADQAPDSQAADQTMTAREIALGQELLQTQQALAEIVVVLDAFKQSHDVVMQVADNAISPQSNVLIDMVRRILRQRQGAPPENVT